METEMLEEGPLTSQPEALQSLLLGLTWEGIAAAIIFGILGAAYLNHGRKEGDLLLILCGITLISYTYFISKTWQVIAIGMSLSLLPLIRRQLRRW